MRVLITTNQLSTYGGSEIVALEVAEYFASFRNSVVIYTNYYAGKIKRDTSTKSYKKRYPTLTITDDYDFDVGPDTIDLLWIHHELIPPSVLRLLSSNTKKKKPYVVFHHMSSVVKLETPFLKDIESAVADKIYAVSANTKNAVKKYFGPSQKIETFPNPAPTAFAAKRIKKYKKLKRLAIVSNHPPKELLTATSKLRKLRVHVDIFGTRHKHMRITPKILKKYDCVVTIGKTVQYCLTLGMPVYVYDHFGGVGYLNNNNYQRASHRNFCGKDGAQKSADLIVYELISGHKKAYSFQKSNLNKFQKLFNLDARLNNLQGLKAREKKITAKAAIFAQKTLLRIRHQHLVAEKRLADTKKNRVLLSKSKKSHFRHSSYAEKLREMIVSYRNNPTSYVRPFLWRTSSNTDHPNAITAQP